MSFRKRSGYVGALVMSALAGSSLALQSYINGVLGKSLSDAYLAAFVSFTVGLALLLAVFVVRGQYRQRAAPLWSALRSKSAPWWIFTGGLTGAFFVFAQSFAANVLGVAMFTIGVVAGQATSGLVLDRLGVSPTGKLSFTVPRVVGALLAICAVLVAANAGQPASFSFWVLVVPLVAGVGVSWQATVNGVLRSAAQSTLIATLVNFAIGWILLAAAVLLVTGSQGWPSIWPTEYWLYIGGLCGVAYIAISAALVRVVGVLVLGLSNILGQVLAAVVLDTLFAEAPSDQTRVYLGAIIACLAVIVAALPWRRSASGATSLSRP